MPGIKMIPVISSNVGSIGYDKEKQILRIKFLRNEGEVYEYSGVPPEKWEALKSTSAGTYLHKEIIGNYPCSKLVIKE